MTHFVKPFISHPILHNPRAHLALLAGASAALLIAVYLFQYVGGLPPCRLCLWQRVPHAIILGLSVSSLIMRRGEGAALALSALLYMASAALAFSHVGVEEGYWASPVSCGAPVEFGWEAGAFAEALQRSEPLPDCGDVAWSLLGISLAGYNFLVSLFLMGVALYGWRRREEVA